jgi:hypothetical protein
MTTTDTVHDQFAAAKLEVAEKVRKLLAKAEDPAATLEEGQAFAAKAQQLGPPGPAPTPTVSLPRP